MTIRIDGTNTAANPGITGSDTDTGLQFGTDEVNIVTGGSTAVTVDSSQRVGIGTLSPLAELEVQAATIPEVMVRNTTTSSYSSLHLAEVGDSSGTFVVNRLGSTSTATGGARAGQIWNSANAPIVFGTNGTEEMRLLAGGGLTFNGDTAAANALDDYEEGTWTPTVSSGTVSASGSYVKIGNLVRVEGQLKSFSDRTSTNYIRVSNLPFPPVNNHCVGSVFGRYIANEPSTVYVDSNTFWFYAGSSGNYDTTQHNDLTDPNSEIYFMAVYEAA